MELDEIYYPLTYDADGFTHGTSNADKLLEVANHFYANVVGDWYCLQMTVESLLSTGVETVFEGAAPVGDVQPGSRDSENELFPHMMGGISPSAVLAQYTVRRGEDGKFLAIEGVTN